MSELRPAGGIVSGRSVLYDLSYGKEETLVGIQAAAQAQSLPQHDVFYVVRQTSKALQVSLVTVLHEVPPGAQELGNFENPCGAIDFAEFTVRELRARGEYIEFVDPPNGLVGTG